MLKVFQIREETNPKPGEYCWKISFENNVFLTQRTRPHRRSLLYNNYEIVAIVFVYRNRETENESQKGKSYSKANKIRHKIQKK